MSTVLDRPRGNTPTVPLGPTELTPPPAQAGSLLAQLYPFLTPVPGGALGRLDDYLVRRVLGTGGMGVVFLAHDSTLDRDVALKVIDPHTANDRTRRQYFLREARAMAALEHENIVPVYRVGEANGVLFLSMPVLRGETLEAWLAGPDSRPWNEILGVARQVALGLAAAHEKGLVHRDIKPANIWLEPVRNAESEVRNEASREGSTSAIRIPRAEIGRVKILDFGLARQVTTDQRLTSKDFVVGTPGFLAPEIIQGQPPRPACDLFALGAVLYQAFAGEPPFRGDTPMVTLLATVSEKPIHLAYRVPGLPGSVSDLAMRLLARNPDDRPASASEVAEVLAFLERGEPVPSFAKPKAEVPTQPREVPAVAAPNDHRPPMWVFPAVLVGAVLVLASVALLPQRPRPVVAAAEAPQAHRQLPIPEFTPFPRPHLNPHAPVSSFAGLTAPAVGATYSPSGDSFFVLAEDGWAFEWTTQGPGEAKRKWKAHAGRGYGLAISPDGTLIITGGNDAEGVSQLVGWSTHALRAEYTLLGGQTWTNRVTINRAGTRAIGSGRGDQCLVFDPRTGEEFAPLGSPEANEWFEGLAISPDGTRAITGSKWEKFARVWDVANNVTLDQYGPAPGGYATVTFAPDDRTVAGGGLDGTIHVWNANTGEPGRSLFGHQGAVTTLAFDATGHRLVSGGADGSVRVWNARTGSPIIVLRAHAEPVAAASFSPDGRQLLSVGRDRQVLTWVNPRE